VLTSELKVKRHNFGGFNIHLNETAPFLAPILFNPLSCHPELSRFNCFLSLLTSLAPWLEDNCVSLGELIKSSALLQPLTGSILTSPASTISKAVMRRTKNRYKSRFANEIPEQLRYPKPYVNKGASGFSSQRVGSNESAFWGQMLGSA